MIWLIKSQNPSLLGGGRGLVRLTLVIFLFRVFTITRIVPRVNDLEKFIGAGGG